MQGDHSNLSCKAGFLKKLRAAPKVKIATGPSTGEAGKRYPQDSEVKRRYVQRFADIWTGWQVRLSLYEITST
jgi:hypothetical protein